MRGVPARRRTLLPLQIVLAASGLGACQPDLNAGAWVCTQDGAKPDETGPVASPWSTGFEDEFCDYDQVGGFCSGQSHLI